MCVCIYIYLYVLYVFIMNILFILYIYVYYLIHISKYIYISGHESSTTHRLLKSHRSKMSVICMQSAIMKTMCPPGYH